MIYCKSDLHNLYKCIVIVNSGEKKDVRFHASYPSWMLDSSENLVYLFISEHLGVGGRGKKPGIWGMRL